MAFSGKKRKATSALEEITFDRDARREYLTGFHKRKLARAKAAQEAAEKKAKEEKIQERRQVLSPLRFYLPVALG
jgi:ribosomal RNA-processing protein 17